MRERILQILREDSGVFISGEDISKRLGVTRAAVWKHIKVLQQEGASIEAVTRKGYRLNALPDKISGERLVPFLSTRSLGRNLTALQEATTTNQIARELALQGCPHGTVVTADFQSSGRGRRGRSWSAAPGKDILMSTVLRPRMETQNAPRFTIATALGVYRMAAALGLAPSIKWPNDVLVGGKKLSGILLELVGDLETLEAVIVGTGINVNTLSFPPELTPYATSLSLELGHSLPRPEVLGALLNELEPVLDACEAEDRFQSLLKDYRLCCGTLGKPVFVAGVDQSFEGVAEDVDALGRLLVRLADGSLKTVGAGDVSILPVPQDQKGE